MYDRSYLPEHLKKGIQEVEKYGFLQSEEDFVLHAVCGDQLIIEKTGSQLFITYDTEPHFYTALALSMGMSDGIHKVGTKVRKLGFMLDCSRNAVAKPETIKKLICLLVMSGYNYLELYTEDTYELPEEPYFGYQRGRYTAEELKEIVNFADIFGLEMVPCIQTLAHLKNLANWKPYYEHMDIDDILLVGDDRTYNLIRKMLRYCKKIFHTTRVNIGGDEAFRLGRGKYLDDHGYRDKHKIYLEHLKRVFEICIEEGVYPEFWGDGFYRIGKEAEGLNELFDGSQTPIAWMYGHEDVALARTMFEKFQSCAGKVIFAGGFWKFYGYAPYNKLTRKAIDSLFAVAQEYELDNILMTAWGDNGNECSPFAVSSSVLYTTYKLYTCDVDIYKVISALTGYTQKEWDICDKMNFLMPEVDRVSNAVKYMLHNDYLIGLLDYNIPDFAGEYFEKLIPQFRKLAERESQFSYIFASYEAICKVLVHKATYGKRLYKAYHEKNHIAMTNLVAELKVIKEDMQNFYNIYRVQWMKENKGFGFEVMDLRIGGMVVRAETVLLTLEDYQNGKIDKIYELEEERIEYFCGQLTGDDVYAPLHAYWATAYTVNHI